EQAFTECDLVVLTTVAGEPHLHDPKLLDHAPLVLHLSLRDLGPDLVLAAQNITDDTDHAVRERTSLHLAEQATGGRNFITGTLADVLLGKVRTDPSRPVVFSPFGLGVLDLAVGSWVHERARAAGTGRAAGAPTSPHLAEQATGGRNFIPGTLAVVLLGTVRTAPSRPVVFSPFGLGVLDLAAGSWVHVRARAAGTGRVVDDFFAST